MCVESGGRCFVANRYSKTCNEVTGKKIDFTKSEPECVKGTVLGKTPCSKPKDCKVAKIKVGKEVIYTLDFVVLEDKRIYVRNETQVENIESAEFVECSLKFRCLDSNLHKNCSMFTYTGYCPIVKGSHVYYEIKENQVCVESNGRCFIANASSPTCDEVHGEIIDFLKTEPECVIGTVLGKTPCSKPKDCKVAKIKEGEEVIDASDFVVLEDKRIYVRYDNILAKPMSAEFADCSLKFGCLDSNLHKNCSMFTYTGYCPIVKGSHVYYEIKENQVCVESNGRCFIANASSPTCDEVHGEIIDFLKTEPECVIGTVLGKTPCSKPKDCKVASIILDERVIYARDFVVLEDKRIYVQYDNHLEKITGAEFVECPTIRNEEFTDYCKLRNYGGTVTCANACSDSYECILDDVRIMRGVSKGHYGRGKHFACVQDKFGLCKLISLGSARKFKYNWISTYNVEKFTGTRDFSEAVYPPDPDVSVFNYNGNARCFLPGFNLPKCKTESELYCGTIGTSYKLIDVKKLYIAPDTACEK